MPFAGYESFTECVSDNQDRADPEAFCAWLHHEVTGQWPSEKGGDAMIPKSVLMETHPELAESLEGDYVSFDDLPEDVRGALKIDLPELTGPIVMKNAEKRIVYAAVLVPGEPDHDGESVTKEKIEEAAHGWMESYRNVDVDHTLNNVAAPVESYILPNDMNVSLGGKESVLPAGTWILASKVLDDPTWERVESGDLTGYSVMGIRKSQMTSGKSTGEESAEKRKTLLEDLGDDWVAGFVSLVTEPAVPKAKFFAIKEAEQESTIARLWRGLVGMSNDRDRSEKAGRSISESNYKRIKDALEALQELVSQAESERSGEGGKEMDREELQELVREEMSSMKEELDEIKTMLAEKEAEEEEETPESEPTSEEEEEEESEEVDSLKAQLEARIEAIEERFRSTSRSLKGQDGEEEEERDASQKGRDSFGRRKR